MYLCTKKHKELCLENVHRILAWSCTSASPGSRIRARDPSPGFRQADAQSLQPQIIARTTGFVAAQPEQCRQGMRIHCQRIHAMHACSGCAVHVADPSVLKISIIRHPGCNGAVSLGTKGVLLQYCRKSLLPADGWCSGIITCCEALGQCLSVQLQSTLQPQFSNLIYEVTQPEYWCCVLHGVRHVKVQGTATQGTFFPPDHRALT